MDFWLNLFDTSDFPPRWHCGSWTAAHGWLHILSDLGVWSAYFTIPCILAFFILRRTDLPFRRIFLLFAAFILFCGTTHLMEAIIFWWPAYRLAGLIKLMTAAVSWGTIIALVQVAPKALSMRSPEELEREVAARKAAEAALQQTNTELEERIQERTAQLQAERDWFSTTLTSIGDAVITTDRDARVTMLNPVAARLTGWEHEHALGVPLESVFQTINEDTRSQVENPVQQALQTGMIVGLANHTILVAKDGIERNIDDSAAPIKDAAGNITGAVLIFRDITERREAERSIRTLNNELRQRVAELQSVLDAAPAAIWIAQDRECRHVIGNRLADKLLGVSAGTDVSLAGTSQPSDHQRDGASLDASGLPLQKCITLDSPVWHEEFDLSSGDGMSVKMLGNAVPIRDTQGVRGAVAVCMDITDLKQTEAELRRQRELLTRITDNATTAIFVTDELGRCSFMNPAAEALTGFGFAEADGRSLHDLVHHARQDGSRYPSSECSIQQAVREHREIRSHEDFFIHKDGSPFPVMCNARPIFQEGQAIGTVLEVLDLTQEKLAAQLLHDSEARFIQLADAIPQLAWMARPDGHIDWYNTRWYEYTGTTFEDMESWGWRSVHDPQVLPQVIEKWQDCLATGTPLDMVFPLRGKDGKLRPFLSRAMPFHNDHGEIVCWFGTNTDISEQQRMQEELRQVASQLSEADRRKDEFLATLSHELRNPLAPIRTGLEVMKVAKHEPETLEEVRSMMERQTQQLITLVDDLLDVSRITRGRLELKKCRVKLADVVQSAVEASKPFIDAAGHRLTLDIPKHPIYLEADPHRLAQVLSNLLNNAAKYTPDGGDIFFSANRHDDSIVISVRDSGVGIQPEMLERIFEMFAQIDHPSQKSYTGLGIGLTLVKSLVEMHGGSVSVRSDGPSQGSEFSIRLPILTQQPDDDTPPVETPEPTPAKVRRRVLVVDDNKAASEMLSLVVKMLGNEVRTADDGEQALEVAAEFLPDVVLMDLGMPKMSGYEAARRLREQPWGQEMLLVALTGWGQAEDKQRTKAAGFDHHLVKPAEPSDLQRLFAEARGNSK